MVNTTDAVTIKSTRSKPRSYIRTILPQNGTHLKQTAAMVGVIVNLRMVATVVTSTT
jgi:hypothetical protein